MVVVQLGSFNKRTRRKFESSVNMIQASIHSQIRRRYTTAHEDFKLKQEAYKILICAMNFLIIYTLII